MKMRVSACMLAAVTYDHEPCSNESVRARVMVRVRVRVRVRLRLRLRFSWDTAFVVSKDRASISPRRCL